MPSMTSNAMYSGREGALENHSGSSMISMISNDSNATKTVHQDSSPRNATLFWSCFDCCCVPLWWELSYMLLIFVPIGRYVE